MSDFSTLNAAVTALTDKVTEAEGVGASAVALIAGFATLVTDAVAKALTEDDAADQGSITAANDAIAAVTARVTASSAALAAAVAANPTP